MDTSEILNKINKIFQQFEVEKSKQKVLVMHPSAMVLVKDKITRNHNIYNTMESFVFDDKITLFLSFNLPINHFAFMTNADYEAHYKPKN